MVTRVKNLFYHKTVNSEVSMVDQTNVENVKINPSTVEGFIETVQSKLISLMSPYSHYDVHFQHMRAGLKSPPKRLRQFAHWTLYVSNAILHEHRCKIPICPC